MRAGIAIAALLGVAGFSVAACAQAPVSSYGPAPVYQGAPVYQDACAGGCAPAASTDGPIRSRLSTALNPTAELGDAWTLQGFLFGDEERAVNFGGWLQSGYHSQDNGLFNNRPDDVQIQQAWLYAEKEAVAGESPFGFRADLVYGIDGADTQAFGNDPGTFRFPKRLRSWNSVLGDSTVIRRSSIGRVERQSWSLLHIGWL